MSADVALNFLALILGFAVAGALTSGHQVFVAQPAGFGLLHDRARLRAISAVPFLVMAAPFLIMRNTLREQGAHGRRAAFVMMATVISGVWSLMSGTVILMALRGLLA